MSEKARGVYCGVSEWVKPLNKVVWTRENAREFTKKVYESKIDGTCVSGRLPVRWEYRIEECTKEGNQGRMQGVCI